ncbi:hypothetical protein BGW42_007177 [Actinomortierella wolfii]|nr:hypothetical protein BGW42_007177 [Actinomortierella wolfii]
MAKVVAAAAAAIDTNDESDLALDQDLDQGLHRPTRPCPRLITAAQIQMTVAVVTVATVIAAGAGAGAEAGAGRKSKKESVNKASKEYGTYGILTPADMWNKESEFQAWLMEVKNLNPETIPQNKMKEHFVGFMEDYNTVTMPHEKYYDLEKWETRQRAIRMGEPIPESQQGKVNLWNDQEQLRMQQRDKRRANASSTPMYVTTSMLEEMRRSQHERVETDRLRRMGFDTTRKGGRH